jgi:hypothetical protein
MSIVGDQLKIIIPAKKRMPAKVKMIDWIEGQFQETEKQLYNLKDTAKMSALISVIYKDAVGVGVLLNNNDADKAYKLTGEMLDKYNKAKPAIMAAK